MQCADESSTSESKELLQKAYERYQYSARSYNKYLKVARTFADLDGAESIRKKDIIAALMARDLDKEKINMAVL